MLSFTDTTQTLFSRGITFTIEEYIFCLNLVLGEDKYISYALAYDQSGYKKVLGTEDEEDFLQSERQECDALLQQQTIVKLKQELDDLYIAEVQNKALNLEDYRFTGGQIAQILQNLLHNRISDLDSASTKDVISLIKLLTEQFGLDGGSDFEKHFVQIYPHFNALCTNCNREFQVAEGIGATCPFCGAQYHWDANSGKFIPQPSKL
jgi:hypothetical protein